MQITIFIVFLCEDSSSYLRKACSRNPYEARRKEGTIFEQWPKTLVILPIYIGILTSFS